MVVCSSLFQKAIYTLTKGNNDVPQNEALNLTKIEKQFNESTETRIEQTISCALPNYFWKVSATRSTRL